MFKSAPRVLQVTSYPRPAVPLSPVFSGSGLRSIFFDKTHPSQKTVLDADDFVHTSSGRAAISLALEHSDVGEGDEVLIPAYHCESMVSPATWRKARPVFYKVNRDTSLDLRDVLLKISPRTKALIVTHYFGLIQDMLPLVEMCKLHKIILIEDCAHAFFGSRGGRSVGSWGDYATASSMKFFPVYDGGVLCSARRNVSEIPMESPIISFQVKSALNMIQVAISYQRLGIFGKLLNWVTTAIELPWRAAKKLLGPDSVQIEGPSSSGGGYGLDEKWIHRRASWCSRTMIGLQSANRIAKLRRSTYQKLHESLSGLPGVCPIIERLPDGVIPLVYPLWFENPAAKFSALKEAGVPIWRFGEFLDPCITRAVCPVSVEYSEHVLQFPCHQELKGSEIDWMIETIKSTCYSNESTD